MRILKCRDMPSACFVWRDQSGNQTSQSDVPTRRCPPKNALILPVLPIAVYSISYILMNNIAFLLLSCDKYYDMIRPFTRLMKRFWGDCPFQKFVATNKAPFEENGFTPILMGNDVSWSTGLKKALKSLQQQGFEYVLITLEDLFLRKKVSTDKIMAIIKDFIALDGNYIRFYNHFAPSKKVTADFGELPKGIPYRQNCVYALWKIDTLLSILRDGENAWDFEKTAVIRGYQYDGFYAVMKSRFSILNTLIKGKWVPSDYSRAKALLPDLETTRARMSRFDELKLNLKRAVFQLYFLIIPPKFQRKFLYN